MRVEVRDTTKAKGKGENHGPIRWGAQLVTCAYLIKDFLCDKKRRRGLNLHIHYLFGVVRVSCL